MNNSLKKYTKSLSVFFSVIFASHLPVVASQQKCFPGNVAVKKHVFVGDDASFGYRSSCSMHAVRSPEKLVVLAGAVRFSSHPQITFIPNQNPDTTDSGSITIGDPCATIVRGCAFHVERINGEGNGQVTFSVPITFKQWFSAPPTVLVGLETCSSSELINEVVAPGNMSAQLESIIPTVEGVTCRGCVIKITVITSVINDLAGGTLSTLLNNIIASLSLDILVEGPVAGTRDRKLGYDGPHTDTHKNDDV